jgi:hypothetical protein
MSDFTTTPNLGLFKPTYDADDEMWGTHLNANADVLDAALATGGLGTFLPLAGNATVTGPVTFSGTGNGLTVTNNVAVGGSITAPNAAAGSGLAGGSVTIQAGAGDGSGGVGGVIVAVPGGGGGSFLSRAHTQIGDFGGPRFFSIAAPAGAARAVRFMTATNATSFSNRWQLFANATAEGGSNAGSDLDLWNFTDTGTVLNNPLFRITRSTGAMSYNAAFTANGTGTGLTVTNNATVGGTLRVNGNSGFNNTAPIARPTVTGAKGGNAALTSLLTALAAYGLITDSST